MSPVNLIPRKRLLRKRRGTHLRLWMVLSVCYVALVASALSVSYLMWSVNDAALASELQTTVQKAKDLTDSINNMEVELGEVQAELETSKAMRNHPDWSALLVLLANQLGDEVVLDDFQLKPLPPEVSGSEVPAVPGEGSRKTTPLEQQRYELTLGGFGKTQGAVSQFVLRLERTELFHQVKLTKSSRERFLTGEAVAFRVECSI